MSGLPEQKWPIRFAAWAKANRDKLAASIHEVYRKAAVAGGWTLPEGNDQTFDHIPYTSQRVGYEFVDWHLGQLAAAIEEERQRTTVAIISRLAIPEDRVATACPHCSAPLDPLTMATTSSPGWCHTCGKAVRQLGSARRTA